MSFSPAGFPQHPQCSRRTALQIGSIGILGLGMNHVAGLRALAAPDVKPVKARSVIYIFLSGGLAQHESFDLKPQAAAEIRGEFSPIDTQTPGIQICEHMPLLAARSNMWSLCRSLTHPYTGHSEGHHVMLTGRTMIPPGFSGDKPKSSDWPAIASIVNQVAARTNNLPPAVVLPETLIHRTGRVIPGQFAGHMGSRWNPWVIEASPFNGHNYGAYPEYGFHFERGSENAPASWKFEAPSLTLPEGFSSNRLGERMHLLNVVESQLHELEQHARISDFDRQRQMAVSLLAESSVRKAVDVLHADDKIQDRYGKNVFGWSCLMAKNLVEAGVSLVQVNLGNNESWDTHEMAFPLLKNNLLPPTDKAVAALLDDLQQSGLLESTLIVMAGEFGRTPRISVGGTTNSAGRNHWGPVQTVFFAGGGVRGGTVVGTSDEIGGYPASDAHTPEDMAATIYESLGLPDTLTFRDEVDRPHFVYHGHPIAALF
ncbi:MAG: DUF1501 domain-containing protein [Planctomycetaceae bacterium]